MPVDLRADLHTHSTASDGSLAPADLVHQAAERGLSVLALTDHDTTLGLDEAETAGRRFGMRVIPGIELSTSVTAGEVHILGYGIDPTHAALQAALHQLRQSNAQRIERMVARLAELDVPLPAGSVRASSPGASVNRPHIARAMVTAGYATSVQDAFERFLARGRPAYIARERLTPADAARLVRAAGGLPVLAHPLSVADLDATLPALIDAGLAGVEAWYGEYGDADRAALAARADRLGLLATGGSDYHGEGFRAGRVLGGVEIPAERLERFLAALAERGGRSGAVD